MKRHIVHTLVLLTIAFLASCGESGELNTLFLEADSLMNTRPDSALLILEEAREEVASCPRSQRMRHELLVAKAMNKAYVDFTTDSVMLAVTDYYDHHGTPNERMLAHYLLGCTYRDLGEAPRTLECYKDAVACADTLSPDCDYRTMMSIYGQMATLYDKQVMPLEEIEANKQTSKYALMCGDTTNYIKGIELQVRAYNYLQDTTKMFETANTAYKLFLNRGDTAQAARTLPVPIANKLRYGKYDEAKKWMQIYETKSGLFDENGNITPRYSHYYNSKGKYFLGIGKIDSAEYYFRKLSDAGYTLDAYAGFIQIYKERNDADSLSLYSLLYLREMDLHFSKLNMESVRQTEAMYDYSRNQKIAYEERLKRERTEKSLILMGFLFTAIISTMVYRHKRIREKKKQMVKKMTDEYLALSERYENTIQELEFSKESFSEYEIQKNQELEELKAYLSKYKLQFEKMNHTEKKRALCSSSIVLEFTELLCPQEHKYKLPTSKQWKSLQDAVRQTSSLLYHKLTHSDLTEQERRIAILTYLDFTGEEIAILMGSSSQRISNAKRNANKKAFGKDETKTFKYNITHISDLN